MIKYLLASAVAVALIAASPASSIAQTSAPATDKADSSKSKKPAKTAEKKELTPQQQKMKDCAAKWGDYKKEKNVKGRKEYNKFMSGCLKA